MLPTPLSPQLPLGGWHRPRPNEHSQGLSPELRTTYHCAWKLAYGDQHNSSKKTSNLVIKAESAPKENLQVPCIHHYKPQLTIAQ